MSVNGDEDLELDLNGNKNGAPEVVNDDLATYDDDLDNPDGSEESNEIIIEGEESAPSEEDENEPPEVTGSELVKKLRREIEERNKKNRELERQLKAVTKAPEVKVPELGEKPTLESCDFDADVFEQKLDEWKERKTSIEKAKEAQTEKQKKDGEAYQVKLQNYQKSKLELNIPNIEEAETNVRAVLNVAQQGILINYSKEPAKIVAALNSNPSVLESLASIDDPIEYALRVKEIEGKIKMTNTRKAPPPESRVRGNGAIGQMVDKKEQALEAEADRTGDRTKLIRYRKEKAAAKK